MFRKRVQATVHELGVERLAKLIKQDFRAVAPLGTPIQISSFAATERHYLPNSLRN